MPADEQHGLKPGEIYSPRRVLLAITKGRVVPLQVSPLFQRFVQPFIEFSLPDHTVLC